MLGAADVAPVVYVYDGTFEGFLCCVFASVYARETPTAIVPEQDAQPSLFAQSNIPTDMQKAQRVYTSIRTKICPDAQALVRDVFFSCMEDKEISLLRFLQLGYKQGGKVMQLLGHPAVQPLLKAQQGLLNEAHLLRGFVRFSQYGSVLVARIRPKNFALPYLQSHFCSRFCNETFLIFDETHSAALVWEQYRARIIPLEQLELPAPDAQEQAFQAMWKRFYNTIAIRERENPRCRMTHCPQRYWSTMCEMDTNDADSAGHSRIAPPALP
jgi:probable DNA metabolism protein